MTNNIKTGFIKSASAKKRAAVISIALIVVLLLLLTGLKSNDDQVGNIATFVAKRGPLNISVTEAGTIKARELVILKNELQGSSSIISLVDEGTIVKEGDLLVELDTSNLEDNKIEHEIRVQNAEASFISAREKLAVAENQAKSDVDKARLAFEFSEQDLKKYIEGEYPNQLKEADAKITLAQEELTRASDTYKWSKKLYGEKYISQTELQADELAEKKKALDLELAKNNRDLLRDFTHKRNLAQLESDVSQAEMALERSTRKAKADVIQAQADLTAKDAEYNRQKDKLEKTVDQISKAKIYAPINGRVIYATSVERSPYRSTGEPLDEGQMVRERQKLIYLPTADSVKAEVDIHESNMRSIKPGLPAIITLDAMPGKKYHGVVAVIAPLPDATSVWLNPDLKVYNTDINITGNGSELRTGMSCKAEIIIEQYEDAVYIPVQAVLRVDGEATVYVVNGNKLEPRKVRTGLDNNRMIRIISGLEEGDLVSLAPPLSSAEVMTEDIVAEDGSAGSKITGQKSEKNDDPKQGSAGNVSPEDMQKMKEKFQNASPEEKEKMRQNMRNNSGGQRQPKGPTK